MEDFEKEDLAEEPFAKEELKEHLARGKPEERGCAQKVLEEEDTVEEHLDPVRRGVVESALLR